MRAVFGMLMVTFLLGCASTQSGTTTTAGKAMEGSADTEKAGMADGGVLEKNDSVMENGFTFTGTKLAGKDSPLIDFNRADYYDALKTDKLVVLYFYANWCPVCMVEIPTALKPAFNDLQTDRVLGFRVNYNDGDTNEDERNLAREFGVAYQHTKVFIKDGKRVLKSPESWDKARYLTEIGKYV